MDSAASQLVMDFRKAIEAILDNQDPRLIVVGPCSVHVPEATFDCARRPHKETLHL